MIPNDQCESLLLYSDDDCIVSAMCQKPVHHARVDADPEHTHTVRLASGSTTVLRWTDSEADPA